METAPYVLVKVDLDVLIMDMPPQLYEGAVVEGESHLLLPLADNICFGADDSPLHSSA